MQVKISKHQNDQIMKRNTTLITLNTEAQAASAKAAVASDALRDALVALALDGGAPEDFTFEGFSTAKDVDGTFILTFRESAPLEPAVPSGPGSSVNPA